MSSMIERFAVFGLAVILWMMADSTSRGMNGQPHGIYEVVLAEIYLFANSAADMGQHLLSALKK